MEGRQQDKEGGVERYQGAAEKTGGGEGREEHRSCRAVNQSDIMRNQHGYPALQNLIKKKTTFLNYTYPPAKDPVFNVNL